MNKHYSAKYDLPSTVSGGRTHAVTGRSPYLFAEDEVGALALVLKAEPKATNVVITEVKKK